MTTSDDGGRKRLDVEEAIALLDVRDGFVHTFVQANAGPSVVLVGADWSIEDTRALFEKHAPELAGEAATAMGHGVAADRGRLLGAVFFATRSE